jgi:hypothetical protein
MDCIPNESGTKCSRCGWEWKRGGHFPRRNCPASEDPEARKRREAELAEAKAMYQEFVDPTPPEKAGIYARALLRWFVAGFPTRENHEVAAILAICQSQVCGKFVDGRCSICGCHINQSNWAVVNKARMATEVCPLRKW